VSDPAAQLERIARLVGVARPGALFPDVRRVVEWLRLSSAGGKTAPKVDLHPVSGFPTKGSLDRLLERQNIARAWFEAHGAKATRQAEQFNAVLAAAELWTPGVEARVVSSERGASRLLVVHDRFHVKTGTLVRFTFQLAQKGTRHVRVERGERCEMTGPFTVAVEGACDADVSAAALRIDALEDLVVTEAVRGELGPCFRPEMPGPFAELLREDGAILSVLLERTGVTVTADSVADAWPPEDALAGKRAAKGWRLARERKLVCTPALEPQLKALVKGSRMLVRSR
jgi:hypothetical protein